MLHLVICVDITEIMCAQTEALFLMSTTIQVSRYLPDDGFLAGSTDTFSHRLHSKSVEVRLQASQHVVQLVSWFGWTGGRCLSLGLDLSETQDQRIIVSFAIIICNAFFVGVY